MVENEDKADKPGLGKTGGDEEQSVATSAVEEKPKHRPCPTCGEEWDGEAVFCSYCGYEETDAANPLHPMPIPEEGIYDAAGVLSAEEINGLRAAITEVGVAKPVIFATFNTPDDQTPAGIAFSLYNDWAVGMKGADEGLLIFYDPGRKRIEIVAGRNLGKSLEVKDSMEIAKELAQAIIEGRLVEGFIMALGKLLKFNNLAI
jgi:uncharacterized membrane protein YgcG